MCSLLSIKYLKHCKNKFDIRNIILQKGNYRLNVELTFVILKLLIIK